MKRPPSRKTRTGQRLYMRAYRAKKARGDVALERIGWAVARIVVDEVRRALA